MSQILVDHNRGMTRVAVLEEQDLVEYYIEREGHGRMVGNVYVGRVQNVLPGMQAAFVDIGMDKNAFLFLGDAQMDKRDFQFGNGAELIVPSQKEQVKPVKAGQEIVVQVIKEPEGLKGARVTTHLTIPGRLAVLLTDVQYIGVSRRIEQTQERDRLRDIAMAVRPEGMGMILRTAAEGISQETLAQEIAVLRAIWESIHKKGKHAMPPKCIHRDDSLLLRTIRDIFSDNTTAMIFSDEKLYESAKEQILLHAPHLLERTQVYHESHPFFEAMGVQAKIDKALSRKVWLKSGGYLVFDTTEAMTVIDVNSGKFVGKKNLQDTIYQVNIEAAQEIAKQLRLRDVGGIIVVDFIDMEDPSRREMLVDGLRLALKGDRNKTNVVGLSGLGLVEMTRKKTRTSLARSIQHTCPCCKGTGKILNAEQMAHNALQEIDLRRASGTSQRLQLRAPQQVIQAFDGLGGAQEVDGIVDTCDFVWEYALTAVIGEQ